MDNFILLILLILLLVFIIFYARRVTSGKIYRKVQLRGEEMEKLAKDFGLVFKSNLPQDNWDFLAPMRTLSEFFRIEGQINFHKVYISDRVNLIFGIKDPETGLRTIITIDGKYPFNIFIRFFSGTISTERMSKLLRSLK